MKFLLSTDDNSKYEQCLNITILTCTNNCTLYMLYVAETSVQHFNIKLLNIFPELFILVAASSSLDSHVKVWDIEAGKCIKSMDAGPGMELL